MKSYYNSTILLVEDERADVFRIQRAFQKLNTTSTLEVVSDGEQAIYYLGGQSIYQDRDRYPIPILILLDLKLPRYSGFEVLTWLRNESNIKHLPVIVLTSSEQQVDIDLAYTLGANSYLVKPPDTNTLLEMVRSLGLFWVVFNRPPRLEPS
ncbi:MULTISPECIES: response regulator [Nostoc]|uniref:Response regulator n=1 Tax=Nostoc paludosum FACHB-159 TaxID=2692908 RepID=A0ABR8KGW4_9NOSO|nr:MULTISPECIES: response regulator [Nostoc]MBD2679351.1 response regulator [Nostoc sp. FACHB-857]MBD2737292.1 response regulator [Nostoc paludosum FACHB-159]